MAGIGLSKPYFARYTEAGGVVSYGDGGKLGKATEISLSLNETSSNILYADNGPAESDNQFSGGTVSLSTDELSAENFTKVFGAKKEAISSGAATDGASWYVWDDDQVIPYLGIGGIIKKKINGAIKWQAFILPKVQFRNPGIVAATQGETISWQTQSITADIMRADDELHRWYQISSELDTEADAESVIKAYFKLT